MLIIITFTLGLSEPRAVTVEHGNGELWAEGPVPGSALADNWDAERE